MTNGGGLFGAAVGLLALGVVANVLTNSRSRYYYPTTNKLRKRRYSYHPLLGY